MSTATATSVTVRIDPNATSCQSDVIGPATPRNAGAMTAAQAQKLEGIPAGASTYASTYAAGTSSADQTAQVTAADGGPMVDKAATSSTGSLRRALTSLGAVLLDITDNAAQTVRSFMADGAAAVALDVDTGSVWANPTARLQRWRNGGSLLASVFADGAITASEALGIGKETLIGISSVWDAQGLGALSLKVGRSFLSTGIHIFSSAFGDEVIVNKLESDGTGTTLQAGYFIPYTDDLVDLGSTSAAGSRPVSWWKNVASKIYSGRVGPPLTIAGNTIAPTYAIHSVGAGLIKNITVPFPGFTGSVVLRPTAAFTYDATGNVLVAGGGGTATVSRDMVATYDGSKWAMSY